MIKKRLTRKNNIRKTKQNKGRKSKIMRGGTGKPPPPPPPAPMKTPAPPSSGKYTAAYKAPNFNISIDGFKHMHGPQPSVESIIKAQTLLDTAKQEHMARIQAPLMVLNKTSGLRVFKIAGAKQKIRMSEGVLSAARQKIQQQMASERLAKS
jgi:hypothetical protein